MTLTDLLSRLKTFAPDAPLVFEVNGKTIGAGFHVTELWHSTSTGIDCGGNVDTWRDTRLQLLDGPGVTHMSVGKVCAILERSLAKLPKLADGPVTVEFALDNQGLNLLTPQEPVMDSDRVSVELRQSQAICKPSQRGWTFDRATTACCGITQAPSACCA